MDNNSRIAAAIAKFPATFALRGHEGTFRVSPESSYVNDRGTITLYTQKFWKAPSPLSATRDLWSDFAKGSPEELAREVIAERKK